MELFPDDALAGIYQPAHVKRVIDCAHPMTSKTQPAGGAVR
jgi:hypothetical protein